MKIKKHPFYETKIGILGGGQLARMLCIKAAEMGLEVHVLSASKDDPAAQVTSNWHKGDINQQKTLTAFFKKMDLITFESEFLSPSKLRKSERTTKTRVIPSIDIMECLQDRLPQKQLFDKFKLPTAKYFNASNYDDLSKLTHEIPLVLKKRRFGYDGYGTFTIKTQKDLNHAKKLFPCTEGYIAEKFIPFKRELALTVTINKKQEIHYLPLVETYQKDSKCFWVQGPVTHNGIDKLKRSISNLLKNIKYEGVITFELFDCGKDLYINEVAPRVHNSAHHSLDSLIYDQFSLHLLSILNLPLPKKPILKNKAFAMVNLIGSSTKKPKLSYQLMGHLHWYGKKENRPGRKMGHINLTGTSTTKTKNTLLKDLKEFML